jgi:predicted ATPase
MDEALAKYLLGVTLKTVTTFNGDKIEFQEDGITVIVGPNNAGKSVLLSEIRQIIPQSPEHQEYKSFRVVAKRLSLEPQYTIEEVEDVLDRAAKTVPWIFYEGSTLQLVIEQENGGHNQTDIRLMGAQWMRSEYLINLVEQHTLHLPVDNRTTSGFQVGAYEALQGRPLHPLHHIYADRQKERALSKAIFEAFGKHVELQDMGNQFSLHLGKYTGKRPNRPTREYQDKMKELPMIDIQGHGVRAFVMVLMSVLTGQHRLIMIDEPEAFLHPPQARELARQLAGLRRPGTQIVVTTHSSDIIKGFMNVPNRATKIVRLTRNEKVNYVADVPTSAIKKMSEDPLLKYTDIIDGLFFHGVILCEAENDCTYYSLVNELAQRKKKAAKLDIHFTHCNGNSRIADAADLLIKAGVPTATIVDLDTVLEDHLLKELILAHKGDIAQIAGRMKSVKEAIKQRSSPVNREKATSAIRRVLNKKPGQPQSPTLSSEEVKAIQKELKVISGRDAFKRHGISDLTGQANSDLKFVVSYLNSIGIFPVEEGELESFHQEIPKEPKIKWLVAVLTNRDYEKKGSQHKFIKRVREYIESAQRQSLASAVGESA